MRAPIASRSSSSSLPEPGRPASAEARVEQLEDQRGRLRVVDQDLALVRLGELAPHALAVAAVGAQDLHVAPRHRGPRHEPVQEIRLGVAHEDRDHRLLDRRGEA